MAGMSLFGRQSTVMATGNHEWQVLLDEVNKSVPAKLTWIRREYLQKIEDHEAKKKWDWPQMTLSRPRKKEILIEAGTIGEDADEQGSWDPVLVLGNKCPPGGLEAQTMIYGCL